MGTIAQKFNYSFEAKDLIKDSINNLGGSITSETELKEYATELDNIYDNLPKVNGEGTSITLSNTLKGKLDFEDGIVGIGDTKQEGTPTPDNPQDIEVVRGKNLFQFLTNETKTNNGITTTTNNSSITINGTSSGTVTIENKIKPLSLVGTYKLSGYTRNDNYVDLYYKDSSGTIKFVHCKDTPTITFSEGDTLYSIFIYIANGTSITFNNETFNLQLEKGSTATSFLPYNTLEVKVNNGNIAEVNTSDFTLEDNAISTNKNNGELLFKGVSLKANITYYLKFILLQRPTTATSLSAYIDNVTNNDLSILSFERENRYTLGQLYTTTYTPTKDVTLTTKIWGNANRDTIKFQYWITPDSNMNTYKPFQETTQQLSLGDIEMCKIGNYVDTIEYDVDNDKVYKNKAIRKKVLNSGSDEDWAYETTYNRFALIETINDYNITLRTTAICNYYRYGDTSIDNYFALSSNGKLALFHAPTNISTLAEWKTWLSTHNLEVYYILAEEVKEEITGTLKDQIKALYYSHSFTGTTIITSNGNLPMIIKVRALKGE